ncbi:MULTISPECIES: transglycosylase family protein [unclassified Streptomyces]|uniref:LysM peptidoglycan-binding domain-containing protein n=1 Tax=unclassified Streptomyces TaxID=2593676 RepID=UPI0004BF418A|nr:MULTISPECIES: transglycosylase family protein [unclassified Streptomyces]
MLSGNGRHRRPRQAPALLVAAGVTGSAIAIPLLGATGASAASGTTWDQVAECESGGSWSADSGNNLYGGLQLSQDDWNNYGGLDYAASPDKASRSQQIAVAEKILDAEGVAAWPTCGPLSGLSKDSGSADVDTGVGKGSSGESGDSDSGLDLGLDNSSGSSDSSSSSSGSSDSSSSGKSAGNSDGTSTGKSGDDSDGKASASPGKKAKDSSDDSGDSRSGGDSARSTESGDKSGSSSARGSKGGESDQYRQGPASSALVDTGSVDGTKGANTLIADGTGRHRGSSAEEGSTYTVRDGDTLGSIADSLGVDGGWRALYDDNKGAIGGDPSVIHPGQSLVVE